MPIKCATPKHTLKWIRTKHKVKQVINVDTFHIEKVSSKKSIFFISMYAQKFAFVFQSTDAPNSRTASERTTYAGSMKFGQ